MRWDIPKPDHSNPWRRWFAWYPVQVGNQMVWWEHVERRRARLQNPVLDPAVAMEFPDMSYAETGFWEYRFPAPPATTLGSAGNP